MAAHPQLGIVIPKSRTPHIIPWVRSIQTHAKAIVIDAIQIIETTYQHTLLKTREASAIVAAMINTIPK